MTSYDASILASLGGFILVLFLMILTVAVIMIVSNWKIFTKAGEEGWSAVIPYYNTYVLFKITGITHLFVVYIIAIMATFLFGGSIAHLATLVTFGLHIYSSILLAKVFGKNGGFVVGLILLPLIFYPILAFGDATYNSENL